jgi:hypothetical protein
MAKSSIDIADLKKLIASVESSGDYNIYNFGPSGGSGIRTTTPGSKRFRKDAISLTNKTVKQVLTEQRSSGNILGKGDLFAVGKYQTIPKTLYSIAKKLNILDTLFDETTQEKIGDYLILEVRADVGKYIKGNNEGSKSDLEKAVQGLGQEFASFPIITRDGTVWGDVTTGTGNKANYGGTGPNPDTSKYQVKDVVRKLIQSRINYSGKNPSYIPSYCSDIKLAPTTTQNTISGTVRDDKGQPVAGATVQLTQPTIKLSEPIKNPATGKFEVKDQNGNVIADSIDGEAARRQASDIVNPNTVKITKTPTSSSVAPTAPTTSTTPTVQGYPDTPFKTSTESDDFRRWLLAKYPSYGTQTGAYRIDPPPQPKYINTDALKKAYSERGTEYNVANAKFTSTENMDPTAVEEPVTVVTDKDGNWKITAPTTVDLGNSTVTFSKEGHEIREISNIQQTGGDITGEEGKTYEVPRVLMPPAPDTTATSIDKVNQEILTEETALIKQQGNSELSPQERLANMANNKKEELKKTLIPFIIKLLAPFGAVALQAVISKIPLDKIKNQILCPNQAKILELINKRNKLVKQINNVYNTITTLSKVLTGINIAITAIQAGILVLETLPYPATGFPPLGLPPLTTGIIETTGTGKDKLKEALKKANVVISIVTLSLAAFGAVLGIVLRLLNSLDALIQQCAQEQDIPFETINTELNIFVNQSTGVSNSAVIASDNTYKGFALEIKLDETNTSKYPRRFAQALTKQGVPVLKTELSFASDPQVLINQLKFIIDSNPQLTAE